DTLSNELRSPAGDRHGVNPARPDAERLPHPGPFLGCYRTTRRQDLELIRPIFEDSNGEYLGRGHAHRASGGRAPELFRVLLGSRVGAVRLAELQDDSARGITRAIPSVVGAFTDEERVARPGSDVPYQAAQEPGLVRVHASPAPMTHVSPLGAVGFEPTT